MPDFTEEDRLAQAVDPVKRKRRRKKKRGPLERDGPGQTNHVPFFVKRPDAIYMVYSPDGYLPKKVYADQSHALCDAKNLSDLTGKKFHVMRTWRIVEIEGGGE